MIQAIGFFMLGYLTAFVSVGFILLYKAWRKIGWEAMKKFDIIVTIEKE